MNHKNRFLLNLKKLAIAALFVGGTSSIHAEWVPEDCLLDLSTEKLDSVNNPLFKMLKSRVSNTLKGTWCTEEKMNLLMDLVYLTEPEVCVEIGACTGSTVLPVAATLQQLNHGKIFAIDAWSNYEATKNLADSDPNKSWWSTVSMNDMKRRFDQTINTSMLQPSCTTIHAPSEQAANQIGEIDFLHLDGDYSEVGSMRDVELYLPKVKEGGYILLSNLFIMVNGKQPKLKSFCALFDSCEMIAEIENDHAVLFRKTIVDEED